MALTKSRLQQIIREETSRTLQEQRYRDPEDYADRVLSKMTEEELESALRNPDDRSILITIEEILVDLDMYQGDASRIAYDLYERFRKDGSYKAEAESRGSEAGEDEDYDDEDLNEASLGDFISGVGRTFRSGGLPGSRKYVEEKLADYKEHFAGSDMWSEIKGLLETYGNDLRNFLLGRILAISKTGVDEGIKIPEKFGGKRFTMRLPEDVDGEETDIRLYAKVMYDAIYDTGGYISRRHRRAEDLGKARERERLGLDEGRRWLNETRKMHSINRNTISDLIYMGKRFSELKPAEINWFVTDYYNMMREGDKNAKLTLLAAMINIGFDPDAVSEILKGITPDDF